MKDILKSIEDGTQFTILTGNYIYGEDSLLAETYLDIAPRRAAYGYGYQRKFNHHAKNFVLNPFADHYNAPSAKYWLSMLFPYGRNLSLAKEAKKNRDIVAQIIKDGILPNISEFIIDIYREEKRSLFKTNNGQYLSWEMNKYPTPMTWAFNLVLELLEWEALQQENVVLVEEFDMCMHPKYQKIYPTILSEIFPKTQFVFTTNSVMSILGMPENTAFFRVDGHETKRIHLDVKNLLPNQILTSPLFDLEILPVSNEDVSEIDTAPTYQETERRKNLDDKLRTLAGTLRSAANTDPMEVRLEDDYQDIIKRNDVRQGIRDMLNKKYHRPETQGDRQEVEIYADIHQTGKPKSITIRPMYDITNQVVINQEVTEFHPQDWKNIFHTRRAVRIGGRYYLIPNEETLAPESQDVQELVMIMILKQKQKKIK